MSRSNLILPNYGFAFLTALPDPDQDGSGTEKPAGKWDKWAGDNIYLAKAAMHGGIMKHRGERGFNC